MAYQQPYHYPPEDDHDTSYRPQPPSHHPYNPQPRGSSGYQVAPISSYLPSLPSPPTPTAYIGTTYLQQAPSSRNPYNNAPAVQQYDLHGQGAMSGHGRSISPVRGQGQGQYRTQDGQVKMSAYRQERVAAAAAATTAIPGDYFGHGQQQQQQSRPLPNAPSPLKTVPVIEQTQVKPFAMPRSPNEVPPLPNHTLLDYGQTGLTDNAQRPNKSIAPPPTISASVPYTDRTLLAPDRNPSPYLHSNGSNTGLLSAAAPLAHSAPARPGSAFSNIGRSRSPHRPDYAQSHGDHAFSDYAPSVETPNRTIALGAIDPMEIADDDDDPFAGIHTQGKRGYPAPSVVPGGILKNIAGRDTSGSYGQIPGSTTGKGGAIPNAVKSEWQSEKKARRKRKKMLIAFAIIAIVVILGITGAVLGPVLTHNLSSSSSSSDSDNSTSTTNSPADFLTSSSSEIKALLNNPNLHKVFPGMDYTPQNSQYPDCLTNPPSQNNITKDLAILTQLTPLVRLYGTDCNISAMALASLSLLDIEPDDTKLMLGVWLDNNATTNTRQLSELYSTLQSASSSSTSSSNLIANTISSIAGVVVGNEVLFRADMTASQLISTINTVRSNLSSLGYGSLPVGTAELGSQWTTELADAVDIVGANVHPFFAGVEVDIAATWTYNYWEQHDVSSVGVGPSSSSASNKIPVIAETGWPTSGGYYSGSTAGISQLNTFLDTWVCSSLANGTQYWWFEAFDEGWKAALDDKSETDGEVESHWGLFGSGDESGSWDKWALKDGITVPDCGGVVAKSVF